MRCDSALSQLLETDEPGVAPTRELAEHLGKCPNCRHAADRFSAALTGFAHRLDATNPPFDEAEALGWAAGPGRQESPPRPRRRRVLLPAAWGWGGAVAATAMIVAVWVSGRVPPATIGWSPSDATADVEPTLSVEAPEGVGVAVFQTKNPNIAVVWLY